MKSAPRTITIGHHWNSFTVCVYVFSCAVVLLLCMQISANFEFRINVFRFCSLITHDTVVTISNASTWMVATSSNETLGQTFTQLANHTHESCIVRCCYCIETSACNNNWGSVQLKVKWKREWRERWRNSKRILFFVFGRSFRWVTKVDGVDRYTSWQSRIVLAD